MIEKTIVPSGIVTASSGQKSGSSPKTKAAAQSFGALLQDKIQETKQQPVNFSKHAIARAEERGIALTPTLMDKLAGSVEKAQEKGAKNILAFDATQAFIINVPYGRVITTLSQDEMKDNVFTNIDGAVLL